MKKLVLMLAVVFSVSLFSCGNGDKKEAADTVDSAATEVVETTEVTEVVETPDSVPTDSVPADQA